MLRMFHERDQWQGELEVRSSAAGGQAPKWGGLVPVEILEERDVRAADLEAIRLTLRSATRGFIIAAGT
jgi:hypothetical protein